MTKSTTINIFSNTCSATPAGYAGLFLDILHYCWSYYGLQFSIKKIYKIAIMHLRMHNLLIYRLLEFQGPSPAGGLLAALRKLFALLTV